MQGGLKLEPAATLASAGPLLHHAWIPCVRERKVSWDDVVLTLQPQSGFMLESARAALKTILLMLVPAGPLLHLAAMGGVGD